MSQSEGWTSSQKQAWEYVISAVKQGLTATDAVHQYRDGGGRISNQGWYDLYRIGYAAEGNAQRIQDIPGTYTLPENFSIESGFDWRREWILQLEVEGVDPETGDRYKRWVTIESDERLTKREYLDLAQEAIDFTPGSRPFEIERSTDALFMHRIPAIE